ncbi:MAG: hypothetical protein AAB279_02600, partial [Candidatus Binatota bacterium]
MLISWLHLASLAVYLGSLVGLRVMILPALSVVKNHAEQVKLLARSLRLYNPLQVGSLGLLVLSGALQLTDLKAAYRELFLKELGVILGLKLMFSFVLIVVSTFQSMGVAHRFVRRYEGGEPFSPQELHSVTQRLGTSTLVILLLAIITLW